MAGELPDYLIPGLDLVVVGFNPGIASGMSGHYYAAPSNAFWRLIHESGLVPRRFHPAEDHLLLGFGIGFTDIVKRMSQGASDLSPRELAEGAPVARAKVAAVAPRFVAVTGKGVYRALTGERDAPYGLSHERIGAAPIFVAPSPSGLSGIPYREKLAHWKDLARLVRATAEVPS